MRRFRLVRHVDVSGVSGTGEVCHGVLFSDGRVVTAWQAAISQICIWSSLDDMMAIHGHNGATELEWIDV